MKKHIMDYWWFQNEQNRTDNDEQILPVEDLNKLGKYAYSYYSNANFLGIKDYISHAGTKYPIRLDKKDDFLYFSTLLAEPKIYDNGMEAMETMTEQDIRNFIKNSASWYPENVARYYSSDGTYQYVLLDADDKGKVKIKVVPDKFVPSSYSAFRPVFAKEQVSHCVSENNTVGDEYKFITEDGLYLLDQSKIESIKDVCKILSINPLYIDQINPYFFERKHDPESTEIDNIDLMKKAIEEFFDSYENVEKLAFFATPVFGYTEQDGKSEGQIIKDIAKEVVKQINEIIKNKKEDLEVLKQYSNYRIDKGEEDYIALGLIPNIEALKQRFYPIMKGYDKNKTFIQRRFERLNFLKKNCEELEAYRDMVVGLIKPVPDYNPYVNNGDERAAIIAHNEIVRRYEEELLNSNYRYKGKNTGIISALNNEYNEHDQKITNYFTLPSSTVVKEIESIMFEKYGTLYDLKVLYAPSNDHSSVNYEAKPLVCLVQRNKQKAEMAKLSEAYNISGRSSEVKYINKFNDLISEGIVIPLAVPNNNFKKCPAKINFRKPNTVARSSYFDSETGIEKPVELKTFSFKKNDLTCERFEEIEFLEEMINLVNNNVTVVDKIKKSTETKEYEIDIE